MLRRRVAGPGRGSGRTSAGGVALAGWLGGVPGEGGDLAVKVVEAGEGGGVFGQGAADRGDQAGQLGGLVAELAVMGGLAGIEVGDGRAAGGELVQGGAHRVGSHGWFQGDDGPFGLMAGGQPGAGGSGPAAGAAVIPVPSPGQESGAGPGPGRYPQSLS